MSQKCSCDNTLLIIDLSVTKHAPQEKINCGAYIAHLSKVPDEEEFLIWPSAEFTFVGYEYDNDKKKHIIHLRSTMDE